MQQRAACNSFFLEGDLQPGTVHLCSQVDLPPITEEEKGEVEDPDRDDESDSPKDHTPEAMGAAAVARRPSMALPPAPQRAKPPSGGRMLPVEKCLCQNALSNLSTFGVYVGALHDSWAYLAPSVSARAGCRALLLTSSLLG